MPFFFFVFILIGWGIIFLLHMVVYNAVARVFSVALPYWYLILGLFSFSYFLASIGVRVFRSIVADWFYFAASTWLGVIFIAFSLVALYELVHLTISFDSKYVLGAILLVAVAVSVYATWQGGQIVVREYTVPVEGLSKPTRIVHLSDIHVGTVHQKRYLERIVELTNAQTPDAVLVTGDLFDGSAPIEKEMLEPLNSFMAPSYFSNGNHEQYEGLERVRETLKELDMQLLENAMVTYNGMQIVGVNDRQSLSLGTTLGTVLESLELQENMPTVLMYHSPVQWNEARSRGVDLMLSGHTHDGQIFPFTLLVKLFFRNIVGLYEADGKYLHVSPGTGTWGPPMRFGSRNQITVLNLVSK